MRNQQTRRENRLRAKAKRLGFALRKRNSGYMLIDAETNCVVCGNDGFPYSATLDDIESYLSP